MSSPTNSGVGLSDNTVATGRGQAQLDLINRLHNTGVQVDLDLPQVAVIGSQSVGKSSLIEAISGITLPRAAGTCTRCPIECRLARSTGPWQCEVSLRFTTDAKGQPLRQVRNEVFGGVIYDKAVVEKRIRRAQLAILNPHRPAKEIRESDKDIVNGSLTFSSNCVSLKISGPECADLAFVDLPGIIASGGQPGDKELIESLVTSYIQRPNTIILLTVACETDFENQGAHSLAKLHDPLGKRTIGVLTKPDRIALGEEGSWIPYITGDREVLEHNWYCVKQPSSNDLKKILTWHDARHAENLFFSTTAPWAALDSSVHQYLGTANLVECLSQVLSDLISQTLPKLQKQLEIALQNVRASIAALPRPPSADPHGEITSMVHDFLKDLRTHAVTGTPCADGLIQALRPAQIAFKDRIRSTAPEFRPYARASESGGASTYAPPKFLSQEGDFYLATKTGKPEDCIYIDEVYRRAQDARSRELPGHIPFDVRRHYVEQVVAKWQEPALALVFATHAHLEKHVEALVERRFASFGQGQLKLQVSFLVKNEIKACYERARDRVTWLLALERPPFTLNEHYLSDYKSKFIAFYKKTRVEETNGDIVRQVDTAASALRELSEEQQKDHPVFKVIAGLGEMGISVASLDEIYKILPPDPMEHALDIMADVRAYFQVAYKRFVDNIALAVDHELVLGTERVMLKALNKNLRINGPDGERICREFAQESQQIATKRQELEKKLQRLQTASFELSSPWCLSS